ncbi:MAG: LysE family transporter [Burkholderiaceae bacterium]|nr:LysE family transporter [Burkholderiaceae bacterium]
MFSWSSFLIYAFVTTITPGPNNLMSMSCGSQKGFIKALPFNAGIYLGFCCVMLLCTFFCTALTNLLPDIMRPLLFLSASYMLYLAWTVYRSSHRASSKVSFDSFSFVAGILLQFVNGKIWVYGIVSMQSFILPHYSENIPLLVMFSILLATIGASCNLVWSAFGTILKRIFSKHARTLNTIFALSLVYCAFSLFI